MKKLQKSQKSRTYNSLVNSIVGIGSSIIMIILNFLVRIVIVRVLGEEINGIHNLFQSITHVIALIEAGFSTAMVIHLYKPIKEEDQENIRVIMYFYKKVYRVIALVFLVISIILTFVGIPYIVKSTIPIQKVQGYFLVYMLVTPANYLTFYKTSILFAEQKNRIKVMVTTGCEILFRTMQVLSVIIFKQYYLLLILMIVEKVVENLICRDYVDKRHPYLKKRSKIHVTQELKDSIFSTVKPIFVNSVAANVQNSAKSVLISILLGNVSIVGYFGNYYLVTSTALLLFSQFGAAITSSFGNLAVEGNKKHMYAVYRKISFLLGWGAILLCSGFVCCIQPFITLFFGKKFLLGMPIVIILTVEMFINLLNVPVISVQNAMGLHRLDQYIMALQAAIAIVLGFVLGKIFGMGGIFLGLLIPQFCCTLVNKGVIINKYVFKKKASTFLKLLVRDILKAFFVIELSYIVANFISVKYLLIEIILRGCVAIIISGISFVILSRNNKYFKDVMKLGKNMMSKIRTR